MNFISKIKTFVWSKHFIKHLGLIALTYILVVFITIFYLDFSTSHGEKIKVPILVGKNVKSIKHLVEESGLAYEILDSIYAPKLPSGTIVSQDPRPTDSTFVFVKSSRIIKLRVSKKTRLVEMPSLIHKSERFAISVLKNRGLKYSITYKPTSEANGAVLEQFYKKSMIKEGTKISIGSTIHLIVGKNQMGEPVEVPNLVGLTISEVNARLQSMRLSIFSTYLNCLNSSDSSLAKVFSQSPEYIEGQTIPSGSTISIQLDKNYTGSSNSDESN